MTSFKIIIAMLISFLLTAFIFLNSYEIAFNKDLKYINSLEQVKLSSFEDNYNLKDIFTGINFSQTKYGNPISLNISDKYKLEIAKPIYSNNAWLARANAGHFLAINPKNNATIEDLLIYARESLKTINDPLSIEKGDIIHVDTIQGWRYIFRVNTVEESHNIRPYVVSESSKPSLVILLQNTKTNTNTIIDADYIVTEKASQ